MIFEFFRDVKELIEGALFGSEQVSRRCALRSIDQLKASMSPLPPGARFPDYEKIINGR